MLEVRQQSKTYQDSTKDGQLVGQHAHNIPPYNPSSLSLSSGIEVFYTQSGSTILKKWFNFSYCA